MMHDVNSKIYGKAPNILKVEIKKNDQSIINLVEEIFFPLDFVMNRD